VFNVISRKRILDFAEMYPEARVALLQWYHDVSGMQAENFNELKQRYPNASIVADSRVVFNIVGNRYRLVVRFSFEYKAVQIKWFGPHAAYDVIDVNNVQP
jgi:mRNA interferase HigB